MSKCPPADHAAATIGALGNRGGLWLWLCCDALPVFVLSYLGIPVLIVWCCITGFCVVWCIVRYCDVLRWCVCVVLYRVVLYVVLMYRVVPYIVLCVLCCVVCCAVCCIDVW